MFCFGMNVDTFYEVMKHLRGYETICLRSVHKLARLGLKNTRASSRSRARAVRIALKLLQILNPLSTVYFI